MTSAAATRQAGAGRHPNPRIRRAAAVVGIGHTDWVGDWARTRAGEKPTDSLGYGMGAFVNALADSGIDRSAIDGLIVGPTVGRTFKRS